MPSCKQSMPNRVFFSLTCLDFTDARVSIGDNPEFSANAMGTISSAFANARIAYCSIPGVLKLVKKEWLEYVICSFSHGEGAGYLSCTTAVNNAIVFDEVSDNTQRVM